MQRYFVEKKEDNYLLLNSTDIHHIKNVMRNKKNDIIECIYNDELYLCKIIDLTSNKVQIIEKKDDYNESNLNITIGIGLVKEQKMDLILQKLTELGINKIIPLKMERSIIKLDNKKITNKVERWKKICKEASEQSKRNKIPEITAPIYLKELENYSYNKKYLCSLNSNIVLDYNLINKIESKEEIIFIVGPEGGNSSKEEEYLTNIGYQPISLGNRVMRVETAAIYIASIMNFISSR